MTQISSVSEHVRLEQRGQVAILTLDRPTQAQRPRRRHGAGARSRSSRTRRRGSCAAVLTIVRRAFQRRTRPLRAGRDDGLRRCTCTAAVGTDRSTRSSSARSRSSSVLRGAVIGGGLELAMATHIRVAEPSAYYALPEGSRGIFVGGGGSVRLPRLIGVQRMADMMLTGRVIDAEAGHDLGISQYLVDEGDGLGYGDRAGRTDRRATRRSPTSRSSQALPRIAEMGPHRRAVRRVADGRHRPGHR